MKIEFISSSEKWSENHDYRNFYKVMINDKVFMNFHDGEPEDSNLCRDFSDVYKIGELIELISKTAKSNEEITITDKEID